MWDILSHIATYILLYEDLVVKRQGELAGGLARGGAWYVATTSSSPQQARARRRMRIEEGFRDWKRRLGLKQAAVRTVGHMALRQGSWLWLAVRRSWGWR